jgi:hypothetical protein
VQQAPVPIGAGLIQPITPRRSLVDRRARGWRASIVGLDDQPAASSAVMPDSEARLAASIAAGETSSA